jgi:predicted RNA methylase
MHLHHRLLAYTWPVTSLMLGSVAYTDLQLLAILQQPVAGNGLVSLAHQLIGAKLNVANGADGTAIATAIAQADFLIAGRVVPPVGSGSLRPSQVSALVEALTAYNEGGSGPGHCG